MVVYSRGTAHRHDGVITIGSTWWNGLLALVSIAVCVVFTVRAVAATPERPACGAHALMGLAMAGMFWPSGDPTPAVTGGLVFAVIGSWFAASWLRSESKRIDGPAHVAVGSAAMVLMYLAHGGAAAEGAGPSGHALHGGGADPAGGPGALLAAAGLLLTGYFVWHAWEVLARGSFPVDERPQSAVASDTANLLQSRERVVLRAQPIAHVAMSLLMAVMFLGTI